ncbi:unnamed protein product [Aureobasidium vineae]|uniref:Uncharacterized protein n=1 Tax=Aureobasidium vineae TaxID=2773715 RepID=A0A9N8P9K9_9PEZI|nr:unnamed protein product [Aureobasidium vineae]
MSPASPADTYEQFKRAFRNLFRRRKFNTNVPAVVKPQASTRPLRPRSASATAAPEVFTSPEIPSWPIFTQLPQGGGLYCAPVELPGSLAPLLQHRSKSDAGQPVYHSDLFSELDATSIRRLSVIGSEVADDEELDEAYMELQAELNAQKALQMDEEQVTPEQSTRPIDQQSTEELPHPESEQAQDDALFEDAEEHLPLEPEVEDLVNPANIALPEGSDSGMFESLLSRSCTSLTDVDLEEDNFSLESEAEELARNDSANGGKVFHDDSSSLYSTDESENDADSTTDAATVSTPRTASLLRADMMEYFDEKIPVFSEPPQVLPLVPAPGMAATSGPLEEFSW